MHGMKVEVSVGELVDKVSILSIKRQKIKDEKKRANIEKEYGILSDSMASAGIGTDSDEFVRLETINRKLWEIEDLIRNKEAKQEFDQEFIGLARSVYFTNDERAEVKKQINIKYGSEVMEEKEYVRYR